MSILIKGMKMPTTCFYCRFWECYHCQLTGSQYGIFNQEKRLKDCPLTESPQEWIPVTERLPEKNGSYLVYVYGDVTEMEYWHGKWHRLRDDYTKAVTHWMPLPEPPKEET